MTPEEENTFRILKDLAPAVTSFWCRFGWHSWTQWSAPVELRGGHTDKFRLNRYCIYCHKPSSKIYTQATPSSY